jgi:tetratricopeptide (TPR) repeat protein
LALLCVAAVAGGTESYGQKYPERRHIRAGNLDYEAQDYPASEGDYRTALEKDSSSFAARFNLGDALYKQERFEEAEKEFAALADSPVFESVEQAGKVFYNLGNAQFSQKKLKEALESYKMSLRVNPGDLEAKYNLAYVQKLLEEQENEGGGGSGEQDKQDEQNEQQQNQNDGQGEQQQDPQGQEEDENEQDGQNEGEQDKPEPSGENQPAEAVISREDAEKMLETIQSQEDKTREKVNDQQKVTVGRSGKNW